MDINKIKDKISEVNVLASDPRFYERVFLLSAKNRKQKAALDIDPFEKILFEEYEDLSRRLDRSQIQESCSVRNVLLTRTLATLLIDDEGHLLTSEIPRLIEILTDHLFSLGPDRQYDAKRRQSLLSSLKVLRDNKKVLQKLKLITKPHAHKQAEQIIRDTLQIPLKEAITDVHAKRAALSALLCFLRQNVGSCFATAPSIIVHEEQPEMFLEDLLEILNTGRLKRTFGGVEYSVPLSVSWGAGDLKRLFFLPAGDQSTRSEIWLSPGLMEAFQKVDLIDSKKSLKDKFSTSKKLIVDAIKGLTGNQPFALVSPESLIQNILLKHHDLTEKDVEEYQNRPIGMIQGGLLIQTPSQGQGKSKLCQSFLTHFEEAKSAFKAIADNALLKSWEFTVASFAETKAQFTTWNLYSSLGLKAEDKHGIGERLYEILKRKLDECNRKSQEYQEEYEHLYPNIKMLESRIKTASSEDQAKWYRAEYQSKVNEFRTIEELRDKANFKAKRYANLFNAVVDIYFNLFPKYFQEVYDADMLDVSAGPYDDSPAGFRLLYKHGRSNTSQWTLIHNHFEFIDALSNFFTVTETELTHSPEFEGLQDDVGEIVTAIVIHIKTEEFLETAFHRMAFAHKTKSYKDPLKHLDKIEKKPWVYTSGGAMTTLVSCYFRLENKPKDASRWIEKPIELLVFLCDTLKEIPPKFFKEFESGNRNNLLMHSPTHAFLLKPNLERFKNFWTDEHYTYTWVRDNIKHPMKKFIDSIWLDEEQMDFLMDRIKEKVPTHLKHYFTKVFSRTYGKKGTKQFREHVLKVIKKDKTLAQASGAGFSDEEIDSLLFSHLPLFRVNQLKIRADAIFEKLPGITKAMEVKRQEIQKLLLKPMIGNQLLSALDLQKFCKALLCLLLDKTYTEYDYHFLIAKACQDLGYAMPTPLIFADTNWVKDEFAFVVNPGTDEFELWRVDYTGTCGFPIFSWIQWLNGTRRDVKWGVYHRPYEYKL